MERLIGLFQALYIDKILKMFSMEAFKKGLLPFSYDIYILKSMYL